MGRREFLAFAAGVAAPATELALPIEHPTGTPMPIVKKLEAACRQTGRPMISSRA
jgi:hypothetical protein